MKTYHAYLNSIIFFIIFYHHLGLKPPDIYKTYYVTRIDRFFNIIKIQEIQYEIYLFMSFWKLNSQLIHSYLSKKVIYIFITNHHIKRLYIYIDYCIIALKTNSVFILQLHYILYIFTMIMNCFFIYIDTNNWKFSSDQILKNLTILIHQHF